MDGEKFIRALHNAYCLRRIGARVRDMTNDEIRDELPARMKYLLAELKGIEAPEPAHESKT